VFGLLSDTQKPGDRVIAHVESDGQQSHRDEPNRPLLGALVGGLIFTVALEPPGDHDSAVDLDHRMQAEADRSNRAGQETARDGNNGLEAVPADGEGRQPPGEAA
jgi:hypothetical protein